MSYTDCVAGGDWTALNGFAHAAGLDLLFDLNVLLRNGTQWDSSNARMLLEYSDRHRFNISWQLGNGTYLCGNRASTLDLILSHLNSLFTAILILFSHCSFLSPYNFQGFYGSGDSYCDLLSDDYV
jgi:hypothetical protein